MNKNLIIGSVTTLIILLILTSYSYGFNNMKSLCYKYNTPSQEDQDFIFKCNPYHEDFKNCNSSKFMNVTGLYCDDILICENQIREAKCHTQK